MKNRDVNRICTLVLLIYGFVVNFQLMLSLVVSFAIVVVILAFTFITEDIEEMINNNPVFNNEDESFSGLLCIALFMVLTVLMNNLFISL